eukprot:sb/3468123/
MPLSWPSHTPLTHSCSRRLSGVVVTHSLLMQKVPGSNLGSGSYASRLVDRAINCCIHLWIIDSFSHSCIVVGHRFRSDIFSTLICRVGFQNVIWSGSSSRTKYQKFFKDPGPTSDHRDDPSYPSVVGIAKVRHVLACPQCRGNCVTKEVARCLICISRHLVLMAEAYVEGDSRYWKFVSEIQEEAYNILLEQYHKQFLIRLVTHLWFSPAFLICSAVFLGHTSINSFTLYRVSHCLCVTCDFGGGRTLVLTDSLSKFKADSISKNGLFIYS